MSNLKPRIYVACLASYNAGISHGEWIDATQDVDEVWEEIDAMLAKSPTKGAEEWAIHNYAGFDDVTIEENESIQHVVDMAQFIEKCGELGAAVQVYYGGHIDDATRAIED